MDPKARSQISLHAPDPTFIKQKVTGKGKRDYKRNEEERNQG
jgi:hypothetical protein